MIHAMITEVGGILYGTAFNIVEDIDRHAQSMEIHISSQYTKVERKYFVDSIYKV